MTQKKTKNYRERQDFLKIDKKDIIYLDESGFNQYFAREFGWAPKGQKVEGFISGKRFQRINEIGALFRVQHCLKKNVNTNIFNKLIKDY